MDIMASSGQRKGGCGHIMASFDARTFREKGSGSDPCVQGKDDCAVCLLLSPEQQKQLATPTYKLRKEKKPAVTAWLEGIFAGDQLPHYEINTFTVDRLYNLMKKNQEEERCAAILLDDLHNKTEEYKVESERLASILDKMGLLPGCLSQSGVASLRTLTNTALILDAADASSTNLLLNMNDCTQQSMKVSEARRMEQRSIAQLFSKTKAARQHANNLERAVSSLEEQIKKHGPDLQNKAKNAGFLNSKARDYKRHIQELQKQLMKSKVEPSINHSALVKKYEEYKKLKDDLQPMKARLDSYHQLPPDLSLARVKVEETKQELAQIEEELSRRINLMHL